LKIAITVPSAPKIAAALRRGPAYVSTNTQSASISIDGAAPIVVNLTPSSPNCQTGPTGLTCTVSLIAPIGPDTFVETLYAGTNATGAVLSQGQTSATIVAGKANVVALTLDGVIASLVLAIANATPAIGSPAQIGLTVNFVDASGASIIGSAPFVTPVTLTDSDKSGITSLSKTLLNSPADAVGLVVNYTGAQLAQAVIGASSGNISAPVVTITPVIPATPAPAAFNDYTTFGYDNARDAYNPNSTPITSQQIANLHLAWQTALGTQGDYNTQTQPVLATEIAGHAGVLFVGGGSGNMYGYDAQSGTLLWTQFTGQEQFSCGAGANSYFGVAGTAAYDPTSKSLYVAGNANAGTNLPAQNVLFHLDGATGTVLGQVDFGAYNSGWPSLDFSHTAVTLGSNGLAYIGTSATCDASSWRGRVASVNVPAMTLANTYFSVWDPLNLRGGGAQPWSGGGIWGWGGVSLDAAGNVFTGVGNTDNGQTGNGQLVPPFVAAPEEYSGLGESFMMLSPDLSTLENSNHPIPTALYGGVAADLDVQGTPTLFTPNGVGCDPMAALQSKSGTIYLYDRTLIGNGPVAQYQLAPTTFADGFLGGPAYSPATGLLYVAVASSNESLFPPGMVAIDPGCNGSGSSVVWHATFGPDSYSPGSNNSPGSPRSVPAVSAGGVVFVGTDCTPSGDGCAQQMAVAKSRQAQSSVRKPLICCAGPGADGGAVWAIDASTGTVLNGGNPIITTPGTLRVPPTIDGDWIFVMDNAGDMYGLTIDPHFAAINSKPHAISSKMLKSWEAAPRT
jgi:hypothetical protein